MLFLSWRFGHCSWHGDDETGQRALVKRRHISGGSDGGVLAVVAPASVGMVRRESQKNETGELFRTSLIKTCGMRKPIPIASGTKALRETSKPRLVA